MDWHQNADIAATVDVYRVVTVGVFEANGCQDGVKLEGPYAGTLLKPITVHAPRPERALWVIWDTRYIVKWSTNGC